jgi:DNA polymerase-3 subunit beta
MTMSLTFKAGALRRALSRLSPLASPASTIPSLTCVRFGAGAVEGDEKGGVALSATDLDMRLTLDVPASGRLASPLCLPARPLSRLIAGLAADDLIRLSPENEGRALVDFGDGRASLVTVDAAEFPDAPGEPEEWTGWFELPLIKLLDTLPFASTQETRYYLNGVCLELGEGGITAVATDGHTLAHHVIAAAPNTQGSDIKPGVLGIVPIGALRLLRGARLPDGGIVARLGRVTLMRSDKAKEPPHEVTTRTETVSGLIEFRGEGFTLRARLIDGSFPEWRRVVTPPEGMAMVAGEAQRAALMAKARRLAALMGRHGPCIGFAGGPGRAATMTGMASHIGKVTLAAPLDIDAEAGWAFGVNAHLLARCLNFLGGESAKLAFRADGAGKGPGIDATAQIELTDGARHVVQMPMLISGETALALPEGVA